MERNDKARQPERKTSSKLLVEGSHQRQSLRGHPFLKGPALRGKAFVDGLKNMRFPGRAFVDALASLGDTLEDEPSWGHLGANMRQHGPTWGHLGANLGPTWANLDQLGQHGPTWGQLGLNLGPTWANMGQLGTNLGPTWGSLGANLGQLGPT